MKKFEENVVSLSSAESSSMVARSEKVATGGAREKEPSTYWVFIFNKGEAAMAFSKWVPVNCARTQKISQERVHIEERMPPLWSWCPPTHNLLRGYAKSGRIYRHSSALPPSQPMVQTPG
ncbi:hypothetical protein Bbelb_140830 [Branchiostoma belcheri]|nr:hypothetical protein Bbelb_157810 [Branchiostoma belcheri]KAI8507843.1 hypothetical protein Bbelb_140830 [Branchiostoma belcheri]